MHWMLVRCESFTLDPCLHKYFTPVRFVCERPELQERFHETVLSVLEATLAAELRELQTQLWETQQVTFLVVLLCRLRC